MALETVPVRDYIIVASRGGRTDGELEPEAFGAANLISLERHVQCARINWYGGVHVYVLVDVVLVHVAVGLLLPAEPARRRTVGRKGEHVARAAEPQLRQARSKHLRKYHTHAHSFVSLNVLCKCKQSTGVLMFTLFTKLDLKNFRE